MKGIKILALNKIFMNLEQKAEQIVKENFEGLDDLIEDKDILGWYKELIKTCLLEFRKSSVHNSDEIPVASGNSVEQKIYYAIDAKHPVVNGRGRDIRRVYHVRYIDAPVEKTISVVACFLLDVYKVVEDICGKPEPQILGIISNEYDMKGYVDLLDNEKLNQSL